MEKNNSFFSFDGKPPIIKCLPIALQHFLAMIVASTLPCIVLASSLMGTKFALTNEEAIYLIQAGLFIACFTTFLQLYPVYRFGAKLPIVMGVSFAFIPLFLQIGVNYGIGAVFGSEIVCGITAIIVGFFIGKIRKFFPPIVSGTVVFTIGVSLYPVAINYMAGGLGSPFYGTKFAWAAAAVTLIATLLFSMYGKGIFKLGGILFGILVGYIFSLILSYTVAPGFVDFTSAKEAAAFTLPRLLPFHLEFPISACITMVIMSVVNSVEAVGDISSTTIGGFDREATDAEISGGIMASGLASIIGSFIGAMPTATFSQNAGIISMTKVVARRTIVICAVMMAIAGFIPKFGGMFLSVPQCVIGGATISVFAQITMNGIKLITSEELSVRNTTIVGLGIAMGMGITSVPEATANLSLSLKMIFTASPVIIATMVVFILNILLPKKTLAEEKREREIIDNK